MTFSYTFYQGRFSPIIPVQFHGPRGWVSIWTYVDSGASFSILAAVSAERIGVQVSRGRRVKVAVGDGDLIPVYIHRLPIRIGSINLTARIGFSRHLGVGFDLLGRQDIFSRFDVTFSDSRRQVIFRRVAVPQ